MSCQDISNIVTMEFEWILFPASIQDLVSEDFLLDSQICTDAYHNNTDLFVEETKIANSTKEHQNAMQLQDMIHFKWNKGQWYFWETSQSFTEVAENWTKTLQNNNKNPCTKHHSVFISKWYKTTMFCLYESFHHCHFPFPASLHRPSSLISVRLSTHGRRSPTECLLTASLSSCWSTSCTLWCPRLCATAAANGLPSSSGQRQRRRLNDEDWEGERECRGCQGYLNKRLKHCSVFAVISSCYFWRGSCCL